jgi:hypothetical protein
MQTIKTGAIMQKMKVHNLNDLPTLPIKELIPTQGDLKDLSEKNYNKLKSSIEKHGFNFPIAVWVDTSGDKPKYYLIDGHQRKRVIEKEWGNPEVPVIQIHAKDLQEAAEILTKITSQYGTITQEGLDAFIATYQLPEAEIYEATHYDALMFGQDAEPEPEVEEDEAPEVDESEPPKSKLGEIYHLGRHRVMCGDSTVKENVEWLMGGVKADMVFTDPPYGVDYEGVNNDDLKAEKLREFITSALSLMYQNSREGANAYVWHPDIHAYEFIGAFRDAGFTQARPSIIQWLKDSLVMSQGDYHSRNEPCLYGWKPGAKDKESQIEHKIQSGSIPNRKKLMDTQQ